MRDKATSDADRFLALLQPIERELETYARRLIWEPADAPDVLQNAVMRAFAAFDRYHENASFRAWMFKTLTREAFALNRKHARIAKHEFQLEPEDLAALPFGLTPDAGVERQLSPAELDEELATGLKTLTDAERASVKPFVALRTAHSAVAREISRLEHHGLNRCRDVGLNGYRRCGRAGASRPASRIISFRPDTQ